MFKRFKKRFANCTNATEKRFCKSEAARVVKQLKSIAKKCRTYGICATGWITKNYNMSKFVGTSTRSSRKTRRSAKRRYGRRMSRTHRRTRSWSRRRNSRSNRTRKVYVAW
jgi:hypothetical protein